MSSVIANDWEDHPEIRRPVRWVTGPRSPEEVFVASVDGQHWAIRLNDFPDEPLYTLFVNGRTVLHFDDWPEWPGAWSEPPPFPQV
jgi:hypothetical protein